MTTQESTLVVQAIREWRDSLVNLTASNRLLNFKPRKTSTIDILRPTASEILSGLEAGATFFFRSLEPDQPQDTDSPVTAQDDSEVSASSATNEPFRQLEPAANRLDTMSSTKDMTGALRNLLRRSQSEYLDRGLWVLYLAIGTLTWTDEDGTVFTSPLLLVPVRLNSAGLQQTPFLTATDEDQVLNPALALRLSMSDISLPATGPVDADSLPLFLTGCREAIAEQKGWAVAETVQLSYFTFAKEAMYRDLLENEALIADHPGIQALATGGRGEENAAFTFDEIPDERIDTDASPETTPLVLDADSSQRACVAAAIADRSFVMDGPPGTGKSQTIANMIGALLHAGKTVLFVSEKAAALEVVKNRLTEVGLGSYLLELHSHKATRKEVALALGQALDTVTVPPAGLATLERNKARQRREELNAYAAAMNEIREPLGLSLHQVIGMIANAPAAPAAPLTGRAPAGLTMEAFGEIRQHTADLARAWRPATQGSSYTWRGAIDSSSLEARLFQARSTLEQLEAVSRHYNQAADAFDLLGPSRATALADLLHHAERRPPATPDGWLTSAGLEPASDALADLETEQKTLAQAIADLTSLVGANWHALPPSAQAPPPDLTDLDALHPPALQLDELDAPAANGLADQLADQAAHLQAYEQTLSGIAAMLGLPKPTTFAEADTLLSIASIASLPDRPEAAWLTPEGLDRAIVCVTVMRSAINRVHDAEAAALRIYQPTALEADIDGLEERFRTTHHGLKKLLGEYRADKKSVADITAPGVEASTAQDSLGLLLNWRDALQQLRAAEASHAAFLGDYYNGRATDFQRLQQATDLTRTLIEQAAGHDLSTAAQHLSRNGTPNPDLITSVHDTQAGLARWRATLAPHPALTGHPELARGSLAAAATWLAAHVAPLRLVAAFAASHSTTGRSATASQAHVIWQARRTVEAAEVSLAANADKYAEAFGDLYDGPTTNPEVVRSALDWARQLLALRRNEPLTPAQVKAVTTAPPAGPLAEAASAWQIASATVLAAFDADRQADMQRDFGTFTDAADLMRALAEEPGGQQEWFAFQKASAALGGFGLAEAVEFCVSQRVEATHVPTVIEVALLREWVDDLLQRDPSLNVIRAEDRDALVAEYRKLDQALIGTAAADIIAACNTRRPRNDLGQSAVIRREAEKKKRHMPVRTLIERSRSVTQAIKPCFMMSPLSVSQYLPADMHFDTVIFDEASQVPPGDAINCIYRASALITAGDQKQLPPTNFFGGGSDDDEEWSEENETAKDFDSILDLTKASGAFKSLTLRWHYRSRHEGLIAFSNQAFYSGTLITFPGAEDVGPDVGIELFHVNGVYRRGTTRDNPVEADKVAERVLHHYDTRPSLSLGVVTFSLDQAVAVELAVERARAQRPDLDRFFVEDRLNGFFVKNLESVQGDERDVMIFSLGYGPDENNKITMNFGPLNRPGGWRRLNVAITRARFRNEIVSSITAADITATTNSDGVRQLRRYLDYAARGLPALALDVSEGRDAESPFEESVLSVIRSWGFDVTPQVGAAGYRIDMAVRHPDHPGVYVLGVECDGLQYHSSKVARDRDRLREQVLVGLGWRLHRIWGTAWYRNRTGEIERLRAAIDHAIHLPVNGLLSAQPVAPDVVRPTVRSEAATFETEVDWTVPYSRALVAPLARWTDPGQPGSQFEMVTGIRSIVSYEAPVHLAQVHQRLREAWNIGRVGARIRDNIDAAIRLAEVMRDGDFLLGSRPVEFVRTPTAEVARPIEQIHDAELRLAVRNLVADTGGITLDSLTQAASRIFGWTRRGPDISARLDQVITSLVSDGTLRRDGDDLAIGR